MRILFGRRALQLREAICSFLLAIGLFLSQTSLCEVLNVCAYFSLDISREEISMYSGDATKRFGGDEVNAYNSPIRVCEVDCDLWQM